MGIKIKEVSDLDVNVFNEEDWEFFNVGGTAVDLDYFSMPTTDIAYDRRTQKQKIKGYIRTAGWCLGIAFISVVVFFVGIAIVVGLLQPLWKEPPANDTAVVAAPRSDTIPRIEGGTEVSNDVLVGVSNTMSTYFDVLRQQKGYSNLDNFCEGDSVFALLEKSYRESSKEGYDRDDCAARGLRAFGGCCKVDKIVDVLEKDGVYYCYVRLSVPDKDELQAYYRRYNYDMTKYFNTHDLNVMTVSQFMLSVVANGDIPTRTTEWKFELVEHDGIYEIRDDSAISDYCTEIYNLSVDKVVTLIGQGQALNTYEE